MQKHKDTPSKAADNINKLCWLTPLFQQAHPPDQFLLTLQNPRQTCPLWSLPNQSQLTDPPLCHHYTYFYRTLSRVFIHSTIKSQEPTVTHNHTLLQLHVNISLGSLHCTTNLCPEAEELNWVWVNRTNQWTKEGIRKLDKRGGPGEKKGLQEFRES